MNTATTTTTITSSYIVGATCMQVRAFIYKNISIIVTIQSIVKRVDIAARQIIVFTETNNNLSVISLRRVKRKKIYTLEVYRASTFMSSHKCAI
jgi:hypothetical protein